jgi:phage terminase large subunit GpA-like protein
MLSENPFSKGVFSVFKPQPLVSLSEWCDKYRILPRSGSAEPGRWRTSRTPYLREMMGCLNATSRYKEIVVLKASQLGLTEMGLGWIMYNMDLQPGPFLALQTTEATAIRWVKQRVNPSLEMCKRLKEKFKKATGRAAGNALLQKDYPGGSLILSGSNSPSALSSIPVANLYLDEIDRYSLDVKGEGDPLELVKARIATFPRAKVLYTSTPVLKETSQIWKLYEDSDQRVYELPCPHCSGIEGQTNGGFFELRWEYFHWPEGKPEEVSLYCPYCGAEINEGQKTEMLARGRWVAKNPNHWRAGFHISSLYSPVGWLDWATIARRFEAAGSDPEKRKAFENTILGLPYEESGESISAEYLTRRAQEYPQYGCLPNDVLMITLAVDVQKSRLEYEFRGWGRDEESFGVKYGIIIGDPTELTSNDPSNPSVWQRLDELRNEEFKRADGVPLRACCTMIDSGYLPDTVYAFARERERLRVFATKGSNQASKPIMNKPTRGTKNRCLLYVVGVDKAKEVIYARLRLTEPGPGYIHFPADESRGYTPAYYAGLTCEKRIVQYIRGYAQLRWQKPSGAANEPLDLFVLGLVAIRQETRKWDVIAARYANFKPYPIAPVSVPQPKVSNAYIPQMPVMPRRGGIRLSV